MLKNLKNLPISNNSLHHIEEDESADTPFTPYVRKDGSIRKTFSDHRPIMFSWEVKMKGTKPPKSESNKEVIWRMNAPYGKVKFSIFTSEAASGLISSILNEEDVNKVADYFMDSIEDAKKKSYGKVTLTKKKIEEFEADKVWQKTRADIERNFEEMQKDPATLQVWKMRDKINRS